MEGRVQNNDWELTIAKALILGVTIFVVMRFLRPVRWIPTHGH